MTLQWKRKCRLTLQMDGSSPEAFDFSEFHIVFNVGQPDVTKPKFAEIYIYNLSLAKMNLLCGIDIQKINNIVNLEIGYAAEGLSILFKGVVFQYRRGRDNPTDTWLCILAQSSDAVINYQTINKSIPAGTSVDQVKQELLGEYSKAGLQIGEHPELSDQRLIRGRVLFGSLHENMLQFAKENESVMCLADDEIFMAQANKYTLAPVQVLTAKTGMIGMPQLTSEGLHVNSLMNTKLKFMGRVQIDLSNLQTEAYDIQYGSQQKDQVFKDPKKATGASGIFIIVSVIHRGDNRGNAWYSELICKSIDGVVPKSGVSITAVG